VAVPGSVPHPHHNDQLATLRQFRQAFYNCLTRWPDTLFETTDALLCTQTRPESLPHLSLRPELRRGHGSLYAAVAEGDIDTDALRPVLAQALQPEFGPTFAIDASGYHRPHATTSPDRTLNYDCRKDTGDRANPTTPGWSFQWLAQIGPKGSSWAVPLDVKRVGPHDDPNLIAVAQIRRLLAHLAAAGSTDTPTVVLDAGYSPACLGLHLAQDNVRIIVRIRCDSVLLTTPTPRPPHSPGRPRQHGPALKLIDPTTWPEPDDHLTPPTDDTRAELTVTCWRGLHLRPSRTYHEPDTGQPAKANRHLIHGNLIRVHSADPGRKTMWLWCTGPHGSYDLDTAWRAYLRRFGIEHFFRFTKQDLAWTTPRPRTPAQAERWSWLVAAAYAQLVLAHQLTDYHPLPWQRHRPATPRRVKHGFSRLHRLLGTPAQPPQNSTPGPGRPPSSPNQHKHPRYPKIKKNQG
jgi:hypothetical protein